MDEPADRNACALTQGQRDEAEPILIKGTVLQASVRQAVDALIVFEPLLICEWPERADGVRRVGKHAIKLLSFHVD